MYRSDSDLSHSEGQCHDHGHGQGQVKVTHEVQLASSTRELHDEDGHHYYVYPNGTV